MLSDLFTENNGENILNEIRSKGWLINEAFNRLC